MANRPIKPDIDAYGTYARASSLADYVELLAIHGHELSRSQLGDLIGDEGWTKKMNELFRVPDDAPAGDFEEDEEAATGGAPGDPIGTAQAGRVFDVLAERVEILGDSYPFTLGEIVELRPGINIQESPYIALLALTIAHAHSVVVQPDPAQPAVDPKQVLEAVVVEVLKRLPLEAANVGEVSRASNDFRDTVTTVGTAIGLQPTPGATISLKNANEEGVDVVGHFARSDLRAGHWVFIGQVTCAKSNQWKGKLAEPIGPDWQSYLNLAFEPLGFLAIPHHADTSHLTKLVRGRKRVILDRLRLARFSNGVSGDERAIIDAVCAAGVEVRA